MTHLPTAVRMELPDNSGDSAFHLSSILATSASTVSCLYYSIREKDASMLFLGLILALITFLLLRSFLVSTPSAIKIIGNNIVLSDVPSFYIGLNNAIIPLFITKEVVIPKNDFCLEWLDSYLTWNDIERGRTIYLANGQTSRMLESWFTLNGIQIPPKPL